MRRLRHAPKGFTKGMRPVNGAAARGLSRGPRVLRQPSPHARAEERARLRLKARTEVQS